MNLLKYGLFLFPFQDHIFIFNVYNLLWGCKMGFVLLFVMMLSLKYPVLAP